MAWVASWLSDARQSAEATITVDDTIQSLIERKDLEVPFLPRQMYDRRDFVNYVVQRITPIASVVAYGTELPTESFGRFTKIQGQLFKAALSYQYDEETQWKIKEAMQEAALRNIAVQDIVLADGTMVKGRNDQLARLIFGTIEGITQSLFDLLRVMTYQVLQFGFVNYTDPRTGAIIKLDYRDEKADWGYAPQGKFGHFPPDLVGGARWDQYETANGLQDIETDLQQFEDTVDRRPDAIMMSRRACDHLMRQESTRRAFAQVHNITSGVRYDQVGLVGKEMLKTMFERLEFPPIIIQEEKYQTRDEEKALKKRRFLNEDRIVFLTKNMGEQAMGPTMEADLFTNDPYMASMSSTGPFVETREKKRSPPIDETYGVATLLPVVPNPKLLFSRKVFDAA